VCRTGALRRVAAKGEWPDSQPTQLGVQNSHIDCSEGLRKCAYSPFPRWAAVGPDKRTLILALVDPLLMRLLTRLPVFITSGSTIGHITNSTSGKGSCITGISHARLCSAQSTSKTASSTKRLSRLEESLEKYGSPLTEHRLSARLVSIGQEEIPSALKKRGNLALPR
jgi:hypothetical protein